MTAKVSSTIAKPLQGVSQRERTLRRDGEVTAQNNMVSDRNKGAGKRPGTYWGGNMAPRSNGKEFVHHYKRDAEHYQITVVHDSDKSTQTVSGNALVIHDMDGVEQNVSISAEAKSYISSQAPIDDIRMLTIGDSTIILNKTIEPSSLSDVTDNDNNKAIVYVKGGTFGTSIYVYYTDDIRTTKTQIGSTYSNPLTGADKLDSSYVASQLSTSLGLKTVAGTITGITQANPAEVTEGSAHGKTTGDRVFINDVVGMTEVNGAWYTLTVTAPDKYTLNGVDSTAYTAYSSGGTAMPEYTQELSNDIIIITRNTGQPFALFVYDGNDNNDVLPVSQVVDSLDKLPAEPPSGFYVKVEGSSSEEDDDYYLVGGEYEGRPVWIETTANGIRYGIDKSTMPMLLQRTGFTLGVANFTLDVAPWVDRDIGDDNTNPFPTFINNGVDEGAPIKALWVYQSRLLFLHSGDTISGGRVDDLFNLFKKTAQTTLATDPIEVLSNSNVSVDVESVVTLDGDPILWTDTAQLILESEQTASGLVSSLREISKDDCNSKVQPVSTGSSIFFAFNKGNYSGVKRYFTDSITGTKRTIDITEHVDSYINGDITQLAVSDSTNYLTALAGDENVIYIYNWNDIEDDKQSAWHKWVFPTDSSIINVYFQAGDMYIQIKRGTEISYEYMNLNPANELGMPFSCRLDRKVWTTATRQSAGVWRMTKPTYNEYNDSADAYLYDNSLVYVRSSSTHDGNLGCYAEEYGLDIEYDNDATYHESDIDLQDGVGSEVVNVLAGISYEGSMEPTLPFVRDFKGNVRSFEQLTVTQFFIYFINVGHVEVDVSNAYRATNTFEFDGRYMSDPDNRVGQVSPISSKVWSFPVRLKASQTNIKIRSLSHFPFNMRDFEWKGRFTPRSKRV